MAAEPMISMSGSLPSNSASSSQAPGFVVDYQGADHVISLEGNPAVWAG